MRIYNDYIRGLQPDAPKYYQDQARRMDKQFDTDAEVIDGVVRWKSSGNIPPSDILEFWKHIGKEFDCDKTRGVHEKETAKFLAEYREARKNYKPSGEDLYEMRAAFGEGTEVVDIFSGQKFKI